MYLFKTFIKWSYYTCVLGIGQVVFFYLKFKPGYDFRWILNKWGFNEGGILGVRINSLYSEPSTVAVVIAPAAYVAFYNLIHKKNFILNKIQSIIVLIVYVGSSSSTAFIGLFIIVILVTDSIKLRYALIGMSLASLSAWVLYSNVEEFKNRVDTSIALWYNQDYGIENTNTSSFVLYNNFNVSFSSFKEYPIFGTGLGSYQYAYERHTLTKSVIEFDFEFNKSDGNSMFLRLMVETGALGLIFIGVLLFKGFIKKDNDARFLDHRMISHSILIMIMLYLLRQGNYFLNALPLFYLIYYYNWKQYSSLKSSENLIRNENRHPI
ncbi:MAG: hypothetical protein H6600_05440 [Flavobacteriales bacterium]|nr:hypothetical protein [Flavobacteriales bacterium]